MSNKSAKRQLIKLYGDECFIEKLHLRPLPEKPTRYKSKKNKRNKEKLTYHHILEKSKGR